MLCFYDQLKGLKNDAQIESLTPDFLYQVKLRYDQCHNFAQLHNLSTVHTMNLQNFERTIGISKDILLHHTKIEVGFT